MRSGGSHCPFGQDEMYVLGANGHNGLIHELAADGPEVIPEVAAGVDGLWIVRCRVCAQALRAISGRALP